MPPWPTSSGAYRRLARKYHPDTQQRRHQRRRPVPGNHRSQRTAHRPRPAPGLRPPPTGPPPVAKVATPVADSQAHQPHPGRAGGHLAGHPCAPPRGTGSGDHHRQRHRRQACPAGTTTPLTRWVGNSQARAGNHDQRRRAPPRRPPASSAPCCTRPRTPWPPHARSRTPAARAATTTSIQGLRRRTRHHHRIRPWHRLVPHHRPRRHRNRLRQPSSRRSKKR